MEIKIFIPCKKESFFPDNPLLYAIQTGAAAAPSRFKGMLYDDTGDNISSRNDNYAELTAHYWAWKNVDADYYGFFHNRRYLSFSEDRLWNTRNFGVEFERIDQYAYSSLCLYEQPMRMIIENHDLIVPRPFDWSLSLSMGLRRNVRRQYQLSPEHRISDLEHAIEVLGRQQPDYKQVADSYLNSHRGYYLNIYIMRKEIFHEYCSWLFPILDECYKTTNFEGLSEYGKRVMGYLGERLFGIFVTGFLSKNPKIRFKEAQNSFFRRVDLIEYQ